MNTNGTVMPNPKGRLVNVIPAKENVDYDRIYHYTSKEALDNFKFLVYNRDIYDRHVEKILKQIKDEVYGSRFIPPITVDINTMSVVDGQNRDIAFMRAFMEGIITDAKVIFLDVPADYLDTLIKVLQDGKKWSNKDYFHRAVAQGNEACKKVLEWAENHRDLCSDKSGLNLSYAEDFIYGQRVDKEVKNLTLKINNKQLEYAEQVYGEIHKLLKAMRYKRQAFLEGMTQAWYELRKDKNSNFNFFISEMGLDYIYDNIYKEMENYQPTTKKSDWTAKFNTIILNLHRKHIEERRIAA